MNRIFALSASEPRKLWLPDAALAALVIAVVALMIVPLPTWLLDLLLASNLAAAVVILLVSLYVGDALKIAVFPSLLLLTTLVRLALNVSSTRLILLQADAGEVIRAFGHFVVQGNYVVGAVVFLILAIIQFVVIAKGSERVAEVGARFTLDAMPGKQMAIDAELRNGAIDAQEAHKRRRILERESQFYGGMDGAMKFVKGDVIASFFIIGINLIGGLAIGIGQRGMDFDGAIHRYGLLTIGDGLVTQIPALIIATAAGILVTRVASEDAQTALGSDLFSQLLAQPRALSVASVFVLFLAAVPGLPALPFLAIAAVLYVGGLLSARRRRPPARLETAHPTPTERSWDSEGEPRFVPVVEPWGLSVSSDLSSWVQDDLRGHRVIHVGLQSAVPAIREGIFRELGVPLPAARFVLDPQLPPRTVGLRIAEAEVRTFTLEQEVPRDEAAAYLVKQVQTELAPRAASFLGIAEAQRLLDELVKIAPATVQQVVPKPLGIPLLSDVLGRLLSEKVSIRDLKAILEALAAPAAHEQDPGALTEIARSALRSQLTRSIVGPDHMVEVCLLDPSLEDVLRGSISRTPAGTFLRLSPATCREIAESVKKATTQLNASQPVILTQPDIRRFVRQLIEVQLPAVRVLAHSELLPNIHVVPKATAKL